MRFERPALLALLLLLIPGVVGLVRAERARRHALRSIVDSPLDRTVLRGRPRPWLRSGLLVVSAGLIIAASAGPRATRPLELAMPSDRDILALVDVSYSMAAEDVPPSRLGYARAALRSLVGRLRGERIGIISFAGTAFLQCPLTRDYSAATLLTDSLAPGVLPQQGTSLRQALEQAAAALAKVPGRAKLVLIMTDGEDHDADPVPAAARLAKMGARVFVVGIGTEAGAPIPLRDDTGALTEYKRDNKGGLVTSRLQWGLVQKVGDAARGSTFRGDDPSTLATVLEAMTRTQAEDASRGVPVGEIVLVLVALACVVAEGWVGLSLGRRRTAA